ncbi:MAG: hypothetical protein CW716_02165 [Candidatus Bathyarchaeum sp.]|nr:MAG: hypothetical protein CW716_02165 [Candidatus Bathyarchaeum sp.]
MNKLDMMKDFASTFVGDDFYLIIKSGDTGVIVHTIEIIQKIDNTCQIKDIPIGDYFFRILAVDVNNRQAYILCNWSEQLIQNLLAQQSQAKQAGYNKIIMVKETPTADSWVLMWGDTAVNSHKEKVNPLQLRYIW